MEAGHGAPVAEERWKQLSSREIYRHANGMAVCEDRVQLPDGQEQTFVVFRSTDGVGMLALDAEDQVLLIRQYRYPVQEYFLEVPRGSVDAGETPEQAALRELREETDYTARSLRLLTAFYTNSSMLPERVHLYLAQGLEPAPTREDASEFLHPQRVPFADALRMVEAGEISDGTTMVAILLAARALGR
jgi:ADP-ribose pyrophosphatase